MANLTSQTVNDAYAALASGDKKRCQQYWADDMVWLVPGHNQLSGLKHGLDEFLGFMQKVGQLSGNSFHMDPIALLITDDYSADVTHNLGHRAGDPSRVLDINVVHLLRWRNGKIVEGRAAIFGDGTAQYDQFWS